MRKPVTITSQNVTSIDAPKSPQIARMLPLLDKQRIAYAINRIEVNRDVVEALYTPANQEYTFVSNRRSHYGPVSVIGIPDLVDAFNSKSDRIL